MTTNANDRIATAYNIIGRTKSGRRKLVAVYQRLDEAQAFINEGPGNEAIEPRFD